ncbi:MAG: hypothetical protein Q8O89_02500 [Nanoarchaeota archaeon]|nr:hypothetical protein [Nanoarchaeota archaeon]
MEEYKEIIGKLLDLDELSLEYTSRNVTKEVKIPFFSAFTGSVNLPKLREKLSGSVEIPLEKLITNLPFDVSGLSYTFHYVPNLETEKIVNGKYSAELSIAADKKSPNNISEGLHNYLKKLYNAIENLDEEDKCREDVELVVKRLGTQYSELTRKVLVYIQDLKNKNVEETYNPAAQPTTYYDKRPLSEIIEKRMIDYITGKKISSDILSEDGTVIAKEGSIIDEELIKTAKRNGRLSELSMNIIIED